jgi:hypothetical protein
MDPRGKGMVVNDKEESFVNDPKDDKPTDSGSSHKRKEGVNSRPFAWAKEAKARARVEELSLAMDNLQVYYNTLHEEVHVLYSQLHPNVPADPVGMEAEPFHIAGEALDGALDLFRPSPSMKLVDEWSPTPDSKATKSEKKWLIKCP